ncbi:2',3'-cyclic-nucleotide 3'-phosphodiesterase [Bombardia bombarda]|uniref:2',3'-cyclic-nucleotide 3'-phosphodiesterase n=1 Tax=Bombardia bombarda TaxID=252184 RepID=A0AA39WHS5_9PEZI|nr:2',3'-cyclic-nucleotide 3'-phosphodiesterase [Bombardia bombarda]
MPGSSLWLLPPPSHPLHQILSTLISSTLPALFPAEASADSPSISPHFFAPHMTLTSEIDPALYGDDPQAWLDSIPWASLRDQVHVRFEGIQSQDVLVRRCFIRVSLGGVRKVVGLARAWGVYGGEDVGEGSRTETWLERWKVEYGPHVSLMYGTVPIGEERLMEVVKVVEETGVRLKSDGSRGEKDGKDNGWGGGVLWLVPTGSKPIPDWKPIATRAL